MISPTKVFIMVLQGNTELAIDYLSKSFNL